MESFDNRFTSEVDFKMIYSAISMTDVLYLPDLNPNLSSYTIINNENCDRPTKKWNDVAWSKNTVNNEHS
jgi:hypothetical protein